MGSGNSRLNGAEGETVPTKIRSTIIGRFEEYRKRRNGESKKQLLKEEDGSIVSESSHETDQTEDHKVMMTKEIQLQPSNEEKGVQIANTEILSRVVPISNLECETKAEVVEEEKDNIKDNNNIEQVNKDIDPNQDEVIHADEKIEAEIKTEEGNVVVEIVEEVKPENEQKVSAKSDDNDSDCDDEESEEFGRLLFPGSPSFRIYCIEAEQRKEEEECKSPTNVMHQKSHSADSVESAASRNSIISNQERLSQNHARQVVVTESTTKRKGNKMKKFGPVKTLLKVKSCYYPCTCTGDDRRQLIAAKAVN